MTRKTTTLIGLTLLCAGALLAWYTQVSGTIEEDRPLKGPGFRPVPTILVSTASKETFRSFPSSVRASRRLNWPSVSMAC